MTMRFLQHKVGYIWSIFVIDSLVKFFLELGVKIQVFSLTQKFQQHFSMTLPSKINPNFSFKHPKIMRNSESILI